MKLSKFQQKKNLLLRAKAKKLYKQGLSTREVGKIIGRSHTWVENAVKSLSTVS